MNVARSGPAVRKQACTAEERARLRRERQVLAFARHPGVVELLAAEPDSDRLGRPEVLVLRAVEGGRLADTGAMPDRRVAALGAAIATVLADLHDIGVVHGRVEPSHVLLAADGRPVLCGLGRGRCPGLADGPNPADDVAALGTMLGSLLDPAPSGRLLKALVRTGHPVPARRPTARRLASTLGDLAAGAGGPPGGKRPGRPRPGRRLAVACPPADPPRHAPGGAPPAGTGWRRGRPALAAVVVTAVVAVCVVGLTLAWATESIRPPLVTPGGIVVTAAGRYRIGGPGDQIVLGRRGCPGGAVPAVLRAGTGEVWAFDGWAKPAGVLDPRLVARVPGAIALRVPAAASGCDHLVVLRRSGPPVTLMAWPR